MCVLCVYVFFAVQLRDPGPDGNFIFVHIFLFTVE
jgi:hypothetical protein